MESFIREYNIDNDICDELIAYFHRSDSAPGTTGQGVMNHIKDSTDAEYTDFSVPVMNEYLRQLHVCLDQYIEEFPYTCYYAPFDITEPIRIQWYKPGQGFKVWHCEETGEGILPRRHLVFMTYLNDVYDGGGTHFYHQKYTCKARKGKTVIWPSQWTYTHRGEISPTENKYIITGWWDFYDSEEEYNESWDHNKREYKRSLSRKSAL